MRADSYIIFSIFKKDLRGLLPLVLLTAGLFAAEAVLAAVELEELGPLMGLLQQYIPWLCLFACTILLIAVFQQDPAASLSHDWLTRPISARNLFLAKSLFLFLAIFVPMTIARFAVNIYHGLSLMESFLEASFIEKSWTLIVAPLVVAAAILSRSLLHCIGVLMGLLLVLLIIASVTPASSAPNPDAFGSESTMSSLDWLIGNLLALLLFGVCGAVYYLQYHSRKSKPAWIAFGATMVVSGLVINSIMRAPSWATAFAIQQSVVSKPALAVQNSLSLDGVSACFPASVINPETAGDQTVGAQHYSERQFARAGAGALSFVTSTTSRGIPENWRVMPLKATISYSADSLNSPIKLLPSGNADANPITPHNNGSSLFWLIPAELTQQLADDPTTQLKMDHSLGLLSPTRFEIETDNVRRHFPKLGYCSAKLNTIQNQVEIDCFKRGIQPALISAELVDIPASRVDSGRPNFSPAWLQLLDGEHYELTVQSPTLVDSSTVILTAYELEGFFNKQKKSPGMLGAAMSSCPLDIEYLTSQSSWGDKSPHETNFITVERDLRLEVLDWGGTGTTLVLLAGGGATAHSYDELAQRLTDNYHVIAITRRGFGASSKPDYGYDIARLSQDVLEVLDSLEIDSSILVGHSLAGHELSLLGAQHPERFSGLIYLDAGYDNSQKDKPDARLFDLLPPSPGATPSDLVSYEAALKYSMRLGGAALPEGEMMASVDFSTGTMSSDPRLADAIMAGLEPPEYEKILLPALSIYAIDQASPEDYIKPWFDRNDPLVQSTVEELYQIRSTYQVEQIQQFGDRVRHSEVIVIENSKHWVFLVNEDEVVSAIDSFVEKNRL